jgi:hypothetical protein
MKKRIPLPEPIARIYQAAADLEALYPNRKFTPDGHLVGSIGEVIAAEALGLTLYPMSQPGHDAYDSNGDAQIKMTAGTRIAMYATCDRLIVLRVVSPEEAEIVYDGPGQPVWGESRQDGQEWTAGRQLVSPPRHRGPCVDPAKTTAAPPRPSRWQSDPRLGQNPYTSLGLCPWWHIQNG